MGVFAFDSCETLESAVVGVAVAAWLLGVDEAPIARVGDEPMGLDS